MTPNSIEVLIHCHCSPINHPRADAPAVKSALRELEENGLITRDFNEADRACYDAGSYKTTERGVAHIEQLCQLSFPVSMWVGANGQVIVHNNGLERTQARCPLLRNC